MELSDLEIAANREILAYLRRERPSAHSDLADELISASSAIPGVDYFCPDPQNYAYLLAFVPGGRIIGVAIGMGDILVPISGGELADALADGAVRAANVGEQWVRLGIFSKDLDRERLRLARWLRAACAS